MKKEMLHNFGLLMLGNAIAYTNLTHYQSGVACGIIGLVSWGASVLVT